MMLIICLCLTFFFLISFDDGCIRIVDCFSTTPPPTTRSALLLKSSTTSTTDAIGSATTTTNNYWTTSQQAKEQTPPNILSQIQKSNWRGGLEPATDVTYPPVECKVIQGSIPPDFPSGTLFRNGPGRIRIGPSIYGHWFDGDGYIVKLSFHHGSNNSNNDDNDDDNDDSKVKVTFQGAYVQTEKYKNEMNNNGIDGLRERGAWTDANKGNLLSNIFRKPSHNANTSTRLVTTFDRKRLLLALSEGGPPYAMDPYTLQTIGTYDYNAPDEFGNFNSMASAHPLECETTGEFYTFGLRLGIPSAWPSLTVLKVYKFVPDDNNNDEGDNNDDKSSTTNNNDSDSSSSRNKQHKKLERVQTINMPAIAFIHDMAISKKHVCFIIPPYEASGYDSIDSLITTPPLGKRFRWNSERGTRILILKRSDLSIVVDTTTKDEYLSLYHIINAIDIHHHDDENDEQLVEIQFAAHNGPRENIERSFGDMYHEVFTDAERCRLCSITVNIKDGTVSNLRDDIISPEKSGASAFELPNIHPSFIGGGGRHRYVFTNAAYPSKAELTNCIERLDLSSKTNQQVDRAYFGPDRFAGEPVIIPKKNMMKSSSGRGTNDEMDNNNNQEEEELNAYVVTFVYDSSKHVTDCLILDAGYLGMGPIATIRLPTHIPFGFHGTWTDELFV